MKKLLLILTLTLALAATAQAQLLWKITRPGSDAKPSYLFGTHHIADTAVLDSVAGFDEVFASTDKVYGEVVMSEMYSPANAAVMKQYSMAPADSTLSRLLSPAQLDSLQVMADKYLEGTPVRMLDGVKPAVVETIFDVAISAKYFPEMSGRQPMDAVIQQRAIAEGKEVGGLEDVETQCKALFGSPVIDQAADLMSLVRDEESHLDIARRLAKAYMHGDIKEILHIIEGPATGFSPDEADRIAYKRNADWLRVLAGLLPAASIFIAVGAAHLPGEKGLINGLRNMGFQVEPVENNQKK